jgi:hypothetical protein
MGISLPSLAIGKNAKKRWAYGKRQKSEPAL